MNRDVVKPEYFIAGRRKRRIVIAGAVLGLAVTFAGVAIFQHGRSRAARRREARAVAALRSLGAEVEDQLTFPLGVLLPGTGAAGYRFAVRLRNRSVTDNRLAVLDEFDADRVGSLDLLNCAVGDLTLARAGRFHRLTLLGLGQARKSQAEPWPTGPTGLLSEAGFVHLARMPDLQTVGLHGPDVTDLALVHLAGAGSFAS